MKNKTFSKNQPYVKKDKPTSLNRVQRPNNKKNQTATADKKIPPVNNERIQKVLARGGIGSRREIERWITEGRFMINGQLVTLGTHLKTGDELKLDGRIIEWSDFIEQPTRVLLYHKPIGEVVTRNDPQNRPTIFANLPPLETDRWVTVGRLDINTSGLLIVTNNGTLANKLMHPSTEVEREYAVRILGDVSEETIEKLKHGVMLEDGEAKFNQIYFFGGEGANKWYHVIVSEGRNRLVRRLWESQNMVVSRLMRVRYGIIVLPKHLKERRFYEITPQELELLFEFAGLNHKKTK